MILLIIIVIAAIWYFSDGAAGACNRAPPTGTEHMASHVVLQLF